MNVKFSRGLALIQDEIFPFLKYSTLYFWLIRFGFRSIDNNRFIDFLCELGQGGKLVQGEKHFLLNLLENKKYTQLQVLWSFFGMAAHLFPKFAKFPVNAGHHAARLLLVQQCLPPARNILDLGGASDDAFEGALLSMGYPHKPDRVCIVDQPREMRKDYNVNAKPPDNLLFQNTKVDYCYTLMSNLTKIPSASFDLIWCGQSIEHVYTNEAKEIFRQAKRILIPGGTLCLDTPNARLARLASPRIFLHPEHKIEYTPNELIQLIEDAGFKVTKALGVSILPISSKMKRLCRIELAEKIDVTENVEIGYSFYLEAR